MVGASKAPGPKGLILAAAYIRMSGRQQDKSPAEQRAEITKLATREGCFVAEWFTDEAITGDSSIDARPGLAALLTAAKAGSFKVVLAWHTNRISREDPMDAIVFYNQLRKAGVGLHTCCEGPIDLEDFAKQLLLFINQKANNDFLVELSAKSLRGKIATAKAGRFCGGRVHYGLERGLFDATGHLVRRLQPGERVKQAGHHTRLLPTADETKLAAVRYAFERFDAADVGLRELGRELEARGFPGPTGGAWTHKTVIDLLTTPDYVGTARWGATTQAKYHTARGEDIVALNGKGNGKGRRKRQKPQEDAIAVEGAHEGIIPLALFSRVQRKLRLPERRRRSRPKAKYPLSGLIFCEHCGLPMEGSSYGARKGNRVYHYANYLCKTYSRFGPDGRHNQTCGRHTLDANRVLGWLVWKLQKIFLGPGREALVREVKKQLRAAPKANSGDVDRLQKRATELEREISRLVKAIRTLDAAELVEELALVQAERDRVKAELAQAGRLADPVDLDAEAERIADGLWEIGQHLNDSDPAVLREVLHQFVSRITCRWESTKGNRHTLNRFVRGTVELRRQSLSDGLGVVGGLFR